jgi:hypothetical protein
MMNEQAEVRIQESEAGRKATPTPVSASCFSSDFWLLTPEFFSSIHHSAFIIHHCL